MSDEFSIPARRICSSAEKVAERYQHSAIGPEHILLGIIEEVHEFHCIAYKILNEHNSIEILKKTLDETLRQIPPRPAAGNLSFTPEGKLVMEEARKYSKIGEHGIVGTGHILYAIARLENSIASQALQKAGIRMPDLEKAVNTVYVEMKRA